MQVRQPERPGSVRSAVALMYVGAGLTILSAIVFIATKGQLADSIAEADRTASRVTIDRAVDRLQSRAVVRTIFGVCLWVWMAVKNGQGRKWARVVATILGVINLIAIAFNAVIVAAVSAADASGADTALYSLLPNLIVAGATGVLAVVILVQLYRPDSSRYYDETSRWNAALTLRGY